MFDEAAVEITKMCPRKNVDAYENVEDEIAANREHFEKLLTDVEYAKEHNALIPYEVEDLDGNVLSYKPDMEDTVVIETIDDFGQVVSTKVVKLDNYDDFDEIRNLRDFAHTRIYN
jgi:hypothetical protein